MVVFATPGKSGGLGTTCSLREKPLCTLCTVGSNPTLSAMYYAYILKSLKDGRYYYGSTGDLTKRLKAHNAGKVRSTKSRRPWKIHYTESFASKSEALKRERFFKSPAGYGWLKDRGII